MKITGCNEALIISHKESIHYHEGLTRPMQE